MPKERSLKFAVRDDWRPLCDFPGVEKPDNPFPSGNMIDKFQGDGYDDVVIEYYCLRFSGGLCMSSGFGCYCWVEDTRQRLVLELKGDQSFEGHHQSI